jgi:hypothetical protein
LAKNQQIIKLFLVLLCCTTFIFSFSHYGAQAFGKITNADGKFSDGTSIGTLDVSGKTESEANSMLEEKYVDWIKGTKIMLQYQEKSVPFDLVTFHLDSKKTVGSVKNGQKNSAFITIGKSKVDEQIQILFPQLKSSDFDLEKLTTSLKQTASNFENGSLTLNLYNDFLLTDHVKKDTVLNVAELQLNGVPDDLRSILEENPRIDIPGDATFSLLDYVKKQKLNIKAPALNLIATGIYQAILPTNLTIMERNIGNTLPDYDRLGYEAKVNLEKNVDLVIANPNKGRFVLEFQLENERLKVTLKGEKFLYTYKISTNDEQKLAPKTIVQYSPLLLTGKTLLQTNGADGQIVKVYRDVYQGEQFLKSELISEDYYPPVYRVEIHALAGNQNATTPTNGTNTGTNPTDPTNPNGDSTTSPPTADQQNTNNSDLWGKPNEQPK